MQASTRFQDPPRSRSARGVRRPRIRVRWLALVALIGMLTLASYGGMNAYAQYRQVRALAAEGVVHLKNVQALLDPYLRHPAMPDAVTVDTVARELTAAEQDFARTRQDLTAGVFSTAGQVSWTQSTVASARVLAAAGDEGCLAGLDVVRVVQTLAPLLRSSVVGTPHAGAAPSLTAAKLDQVTGEIAEAQRHLTTTVADLRMVEGSPLLAQLATPQQRAQLRSALARWPQLQAQLTQVDAWLRVAPALLGVNAPERFLVELMDRGEMRATGGYIGDYGIATIQHGQLEPFTLQDIYQLDRPYDIRAGWPKAPPAYPWWPFAGFALRDANLSPDFPTASQLAIHLLAKEGGPRVQGVVALTEPTIARVLAVIGPVEVQDYHQTVTAQNLELVVRKYTENPAVRGTPQHEQFTGLLGRAFQAKLHNLSASQLTAVVGTLLTSLRTKDLQVYLADPRAEALLAHLGFDGAMARGPGDVVIIVDENTGVTKANVFTSVTYTDAVTLDARGTATHHLTIRYDFNTARDPAVVPYMVGDYYKTYLRVYTPPQAHLTAVKGFNAGNEELHRSDQAGFQMWGGYVYIHDGVPYTLHFVWSVPHAALQEATGHWRYQLAVQHQAGSDQRLQLTVTLPGSTRPDRVYRGELDQDRAFTIA